MFDLGLSSGSELPPPRLSINAHAPKVKERRFIQVTQKNLKMAIYNAIVRLT